MKFKNEAGWKKGLANNTDPYGREIYLYAERWANAMEQVITQGRTVSDCAKSTSNAADTSGITEFMYGAAVAVLSQCWEYGEELRVWHNLSTQIRNEGEEANRRGGVLNPALLSIS